MVEQVTNIIARVSTEGVQRTKGELESLAKSGETATGKLAKGALALGPAIGAVGAAVGTLSAFGAAAAKAASQAEALQNSAAALGVAVEPLQALRAGAERAAVPVAALEQGLSLLSRKVGEAASGTQSAVDLFDRLGISIRDAGGQIKSTDVLFAEAAEALNQAGSAAERAEIAAELFGRGFRELQPALAGGAQGVREMIAESERLGVVLSGDLVEGAAAFDARLDRLSQRLDGLTRQITTFLASGLNDLLDFFNLGEDRAERLREEWGETTEAILRLQERVARGAGAAVQAELEATRARRAQIGAELAAAEASAVRAESVARQAVASVSASVQQLEAITVTARRITPAVFPSNPAPVAAPAVPAVSGGGSRGVIPPVTVTAQRVTPADFGSSAGRFSTPGRTTVSVPGRITGPVTVSSASGIYGRGATTAIGRAAEAASRANAASFARPVAPAPSVPAPAAISAPATAGVDQPFIDWVNSLFSPAAMAASPLAAEIDRITKSFGDAIVKAEQLKLSTDKLVRARDEEIAAAQRALRSQFDLDPTLSNLSLQGRFEAATSAFQGNKTLEQGRELLSVGREFLGGSSAEFDALRRGTLAALSAPDAGTASAASGALDQLVAVTRAGQDQSAALLEGVRQAIVGLERRLGTAARTGAA